MKNLKLKMKSQFGSDHFSKPLEKFADFVKIQWFKNLEAENLRRYTLEVRSRKFFMNLVEFSISFEISRTLLERQIFENLNEKTCKNEIFLHFAF